MMTVIGCIIDYHDPLLVLVAALICVAGSWGTIRLHARAVATRAAERAAWLMLTALVAGAAIWCTHFIAMLGYDPGLPVGFDPVLTILSLLVAVLGAGLGFAVAASGFARLAPAVGGGLVGLAIVVMHYTGMMAYRVQGLVFWDMSYLWASIMLSVAFSAAALHVAMHRAIPNRAQLAAGLMVLAIVSLHFTGMTAFRIEPLLIEGNFSDPAALRTLALAVAGVALVVLGAGFASHLIDNRARAEAADALSNMSNGLVMIARNGTLQLHNNRVLELFGLEAGALSVGMTLEAYLQKVGARARWDEARTRRMIEDHRLWMAGEQTTRLDHHYGDGKILSIACQPVAGGGAIITYDDVTEAREGQRKIAHMAFHDALTGLPNRRSFTQQMDRFAGQAPFVMLMLDLDRFKAVNDTLGHALGDELLLEVARRLRELCGPADLPFRLGGDEMAVLTERGAQEAEDLAARIVAGLSRPFRIGREDVSIGCSIGLVIAGRDDNAQLVQRKADLALYKAKENGRGRVELYRTGMLEEAALRRRLETELAVAAARGQLELHYQPLYDLPARVLTGFEALLRWRHPERGLVPPADFIPVAEQSGAIMEIGAWVIEEACRQVALWPDHLYISINVSPVQLRSASILGQVAGALDRHGLVPRRIEIEITETALLEDTGAIAATLANLRALGVRIAMDDFGTGYSSLAHLRQFELDRIKIDRSFISTCHTDSGAAAVVRAVTGMAQELSIATTGEGVESEEQLANLIALGCETAQGYLLGRPLDARTATRLTERKSARPRIRKAAE